jgi:hypothetical protein
MSEGDPGWSEDIGGLRRGKQKTVGITEALVAELACRNAAPDHSGWN